MGIAHANGQKVVRSRIKLYTKKRHLHILVFRTIRDKGTLGLRNSSFVHEHPSQSKDSVLQIRKQLARNQIIDNMAFSREMSLPEIDISFSSLRHAARDITH